VPACWRSLAETVTFQLPWYQQLLQGEVVNRTVDVQGEATFFRAVAAVQEQLGSSLWALQLLGVTLDDLVADPGDNLRGDNAAKFLRWAREAKPHGYNSEQLEREVRCRLKSKNRG
jgi:hypothetical protein